MKYVIGQTGEYRTHHTTYRWGQLTFVFGFVYRHFQQYFGFFQRGQFYWWRKSEYPEKTTNLPQVTACETSTDIHVAVIEVFTK